MKQSIVVALIALLALSACADTAEVCTYYQQRVKAYDECFATVGCQADPQDHYEHDRLIDYITNMHCPVAVNNKDKQ